MVDIVLRKAVTTQLNAVAKRGHFFQAFLSQLLERIFLRSDLSSTVQNMCFIYLHLFIYSSFTGILQTHYMTSSQLA